MNTLERQFEMAVRQYGPKIQYFALQHTSALPGYEHADFEQEIMMTLFNAVRTYDPNKGARFSTYFWQCARNHMIALKRKAQALMRESEWFDFYREESVDSWDVDSQPKGLYFIDEIQRRDLDDICVNPEDWVLLRELCEERLASEAA